jgi:hypothetical protein
MFISLVVFAVHPLQKILLNPVLYLKFVKPYAKDLILSIENTIILNNINTKKQNYSL